jgi:hypothetical protein
MKTIDDINLHTWFIDRELDFLPEHFVKSNTPLTDESLVWITERLVGRYSLQGNKNGYMAITIYPSFEDPKEALFYELTWG